DASCQIGIQGSTNSGELILHQRIHRVENESPNGSRPGGRLAVTLEDEGRGVSIPRSGPIRYVLPLRVWCPRGVLPPPVLQVPLARSRPPNGLSGKHREHWKQERLGLAGSRTGGNDSGHATLNAS